MDYKKDRIMKRIIITEKQLKEFISLKEGDTQNGVNITVDNIGKMSPEEFNKFRTVANTLGDKASFTTEIDPNSVTPGDIKKLTDSKNFNKPQINEEQDDISENIVDSVVKYIVTNYADELEDSMLTISAIKDIIQDAYIDVTGEEIDYNDKNIYREIMYKIINHTMNNKTTQTECVKISKKQIKEAISRKRVSESKVYTKGELKKMSK